MKTRDQERAIELLSIFHSGASLAITEWAHQVVVETPEGVTYSIDRAAEHIRCSHGYTTDATELDHRITDPADFSGLRGYGHDSIETEDIELREIGAVGDLHSDRAADLEAVQHWIEVEQAGEREWV